MILIQNGLFNLKIANLALFDLEKKVLSIYVGPVSLTEPILTFLLDEIK